MVFGSAWRILRGWKERSHCGALSTRGSRSYYREKTALFAGAFMGKVIQDGVDVISSDTCRRSVASRIVCSPMIFQSPVLCGGGETHQESGSLGVQKSQTMAQLQSIKMGGSKDHWRESHPVGWTTVWVGLLGGGGGCWALEEEKDL